jgi:hypothetical protein
VSRPGRLALGVAVVLLWPAGAAAQHAEGGEAALSSIVTVPVVIPAPVAEAAIAGELVTYRVTVNEGFRLVGARQGRLELRESDFRRLPITLSVGPEVPAGPRAAAFIEFLAPERADTVETTLQIRPFADFRLSLAAPHGPATPGSRLRLAYEVVNRGNVADTISLRLDSRLGRERGGVSNLPLAPFETLRGELEVDVALAIPALPTLVVVQAVGRHDTAFATLDVPVNQAEGLLASFAMLPTHVFLGSSVRGRDAGDLSSAYGVEAEGELRPGLRLRVESHRAPRDGGNFAFRGLHMGPGFRARLDARTLSITAGEVSSAVAPFAGHRLYGRGGAVEIGTETLQVNAHAAIPTSTDGASGGHQLVAGIDVRTPTIVAGLRGVSERRGETLPVDQALHAGYLRLESATPSRHGFQLETGWLRLADSDTDDRVDGLALAGRYAYRDALTSVDLGVRRQPRLAGSLASPDELRLSGVTEAPGSFGLTGQLYRLDGFAESATGVARIAGAELGLFVPRGSDRFQIVGRIRRLQGAERVEERSIEGQVDTRLGPGTVDGRLELGRTDAETSVQRTLLRTRLGYSVRGEGGWGRIGLAHQRDAWSDRGVSVDLTGAWRLTPVLEIHGSYGGTADRLGPGDAALAQIGAQFDLRPDLALLAGLEKVRTANESSVVRMSVGVRKGLAVPVPFPRRRAVQGTVFEDFDGDGLRSPGEPYLDGVRVTMGALSVSTRRGYFAFPAEGGREPLVIESASLGPEFLPPPPIAAFGDDRFEIAVHRAAALRIEAFLDHDGDGRRGPTEMPLTDIEIEVSPGTGAGWTMRTRADGSVELGAVRPGGYVVRVNPSTLPRRASAPGLASTTLEAGQTNTLVLAVPARPVVLLRGGRETEDDAGGGRK